MLNGTFGRDEIIAASNEVKRAIFLYDEMFYEENGKKMLKPHVTTDKIKTITKLIKSVSSNYKEMISTIRQIRTEENELHMESSKVGQKVIDYANMTGIEVDPYFKKIYGIK